MAAALGPEGRLVTVDHVGASFDPSPELVLERAGVRDRVEVVREFSSYTWWLKREIQQGGRLFDFVYLDGAKNWTIDGLAVLLIERLLRPGGWLLLDDLGWTYASKTEDAVSDGVTIRNLSEAERREPHLRAVYDLLILQNPAFVEMRVQDDWWGWARKRSDGESQRRTLDIETTMSAQAMAATAIRRVVRRGRAHLARRRANARQHAG